mmetsp:Transcript_20356/g.38077  ORF Transcript_20356/g.38077 Transcript_20356/m.38077 type:complete len:126 (+) Transcript_20356:193-570(+)
MSSHLFRYRPSFGRLSRGCLDNLQSYSSTGHNRDFAIFGISSRRIPTTHVGTHFQERTANHRRLLFFVPYYWKWNIEPKDTQHDGTTTLHSLILMIPSSILIMINVNNSGQKLAVCGTVQYRTED